jgi:hypothetical protein
MHIDFDAARAENRNEPLTFTLGGESFTCCAELPVGHLLGMMDNLKTMDFLAFVLFEEDRGRFEALLCRGGDDVITADDLVIVVRRLLEVYTGRPTTPPSPTSSGAVPTGDGSTGGSLSEESTLSPVPVGVS